MGQLLTKQVTSDLVFENVGVDYTGPVYMKYGYVRKPTVVKSYICIKAVHLELVSDLTSDAFVAALTRFMSRQGKPKLIMSISFVGANCDLKE